jgi:hypothetical protein
MPIRDKDWLGINGFIWFVGIVEDRADPLKIGRVRVRCFGWHTEDKAKLPTSTLPWAQVLVPVNSASTSGVGNSPTGLSEGSWVIGFFMDGKRAQTPMILGSFHGVPGDDGNFDQGFNDPYGTYPLEKGTPDTSLLSVGGDAYLEHPNTQDRISTRVTNIPEAAIRKTSSVTYDDIDETVYDTPIWSQPELQGLTIPPKYPYNHTRTTESGHIFETDDTVGARRIHEYHASGTNREIIDDGTRVTRVVGDDYEIVVRDKKVIIFGSCSVTIAGDARLRVDGDMVHEVLGDYHLYVKGEMTTKIEGNRNTEVIGSEITQINTNDSKTVGGARTRIVGSTTTETYADIIQRTIGGNVTEMIKGDNLVAASGKTSHLTGTTMEVAAGTDMTVAGKSTVTVNSTGPTTVKGSRVDLNP